MSLFFIKSGILTSLQDDGRKGFASGGINPGSVMDWFAFRLLNIILENNLNEAAIEIHFPAPVIRFETEARCCITGADFSAKLNGKALEVEKTFLAGPNDELRFMAQTSGCRAYLGIEGGFKAESWLNSKSPNYAAGFVENIFVSGSVLNFRKSDFISKKVYVSNKIYLKKYSQDEVLKIRYIPEGEVIEDALFEISNEANRMGYRLKGQPIKMPKQGIVSAAVTFGTVQQLPDGQLIVLMADHQTSGGYARLGTVILADLPLLAQSKPLTKIMLVPCSIEEAEMAYFELVKRLEIVQTSINLLKNNIT